MSAVIGAIAGVASIIGSALSAGISIQNAVSQFRNSELRAAIIKLAGQINEALKSNRYEANKLLTLAASKNTNALTNYLYTNPVVSKTMEEINRDSEVTAALQSQVSNIENTINNLLNQLNALGYSQGNRQARAREEELYTDIRSKLAKEQDNYSRLNNELKDKVAGMTSSGARDMYTNTSNLDALSQNLNGGLTNNEKKL